MSNFVRVSVEGNIASLKSTALDILRDLFGKDGLFINERIDVWQNVDGSNVLEAALDEPCDTEAVANLNHLALFTTLAFTNRHDPKPYIISERCANTLREIFWKVAFENGKMNETTVKTLQYIMDSSEDNYCSTYPDVYLYLVDTPQNCFERCKRRGRHEERHYTLNYFEQLHEFHEKWLSSPDTLAFTTVYKINVNGLNSDQLREALEKFWIFMIKKKELVFGSSTSPKKSVSFQDEESDPSEIGDNEENDQPTSIPPTSG